MSRKAFVKRFGRGAARILEKAAKKHANENQQNRGSDPFRWAMLICIGYECMSRDEFRQEHGFTPPWEEVDAWMKEPAQRAWFREHDGDVDYLGLFVGVYNPYVKEDKS